MLNLPQLVTFTNGNTIAYVYDASGRKLRKVTVMGTVTTNTEYDSGIEYDNYVDNTSNITFIQTEEGRARKGSTKYVYEYDLKDHLGNTRVTLSPDPADATEKTPKILQEDNYYAFGYTIQSTEGITNPKNEYLYNGKELQEETGLYDYGARLYDPVIGRWTGVDPLAEQDRRWSRYTYTFGDPIRFTDPDGMWPDWGAWGNAITQGFTDHYKAIGKVLTTNPVTTIKNAVKRYINNVKAHPGEALADAATNGLYGKVKESYTLTKAVVTGDAKTGGNILGYSGANVLDAAVTTGVAGAVGKGVSALRGTAASGLGDLTTGEVKSIQGVVDQAERPLGVGGSAASGTRRGVGTDLPIGKGPGTQSDIDYLAPASSHPYFDGLQGSLPGLDPKTGIIPGTGNPHIGPFIRFEPGAKPTFTPKTSN